MGELADVQSGRGLVILWHIPLFHQTRTEQVQVIEGAVEYQSDSDVVRVIGETGFWAVLL